MNSQFSPHASSLLLALVSPSITETTSMMILALILSLILEQPFLLEGLGIFSLLFKGSLLETHCYWVESLFFHRRLYFLGLTGLIEIILSATIFYALLFFMESSHSGLWFFFCLNMLTIKASLELLLSPYVSAPSLRALCCAVLSPWFILLRAGLSRDGDLECWILWGAWCLLLGALQLAGPSLLRWSFVPCEWEERP